MLNKTAARAMFAPTPNIGAYALGRTSLDRFNENPNAVFSSPKASNADWAVSAPSTPHVSSKYDSEGIKNNF